ncbi:MAG: hypothetical protein HPY65_09340 [Syntrophaceae bacterium]|nr:hypothetical protein [Syntrophaceae bacterium]
MDKKKIVSRLLRIIRNGRIVYSDEERKSLQQITKEFFISSLKSRSIASYYFTSLLYKKNIINYLDYISHKEWQYMQRVMCDDSTHAILGDKLYFHKHFEGFNIPMPRLLAYNLREKVVVSGEKGWTSHEVTTPESLDIILKTLLFRSSNHAIFMKPTLLSGGHGIVRFSDENVSLQKHQLTDLLEKITSDSYIFQDGVKQHGDLEMLNRTTLNTIRIDTFKACGQKPEIISAFIRIGREGSFVDNITAGGFYVGINMETGRLRPYGVLEIPDGGMLLTHHPVSGMKFEGFLIPYYEKVKSLAIEAADCLPQSLIGWDIGVSESGPVLIEGNTVYYAMQCSDVAYGGYRNNPVYNKVTDYVTNKKRKTSYARISHVNLSAICF